MTEGNLPVALSSLIGRHREIEALTKLLTSARMVTIAGSGGAGKTRLALAVAARTSARFPDGMWWADLGERGGSVVRGAGWADPTISPISLSTSNSTYSFFGTPTAGAGTGQQLNGAYVKVSGIKINGGTQENILGSAPFQLEVNTG